MADKPAQPKIKEDVLIMMRSMTSAVTGLRAQQTAMDVIGNNIANVNTAGFKSGSTNFEDLFYQTVNSGTTQVNPSQVGYGSQVANVSKNMTNQGANQTDNPTDLYIDGDGFFAVNTKQDGSGQTYYSRVGNFHFDQNGNLNDSNGNYVISNFNNNTTGQPEGVKLCDTTLTGMNTAGSVILRANDGSGDIELTKGDGTAANPNTFAQLSNISIASDGSITASIGNTTGTIYEYDTATAGYTQEQIQLNTFMNEAGLLQDGNNYFLATKSSGTANRTTAGGTNKTVIRSNALEMSNVDLAKEFTDMIVTQRGFQANSRVITVSDSMLDELINLKRS